MKRIAAHTALMAAAFYAAALPACAGGLSIMVDGLTRKAALEQALKGTGVMIEWRNEAVAQKIMSGRFSGTAGEVTGRLLSGTSYTITFADGGKGPSRIVVIGAGTGTSPALPIHSAARPPVDEAQLAKQRAAARDLVLKRMQADAEAVRKRLAELPPGKHIIRTQAVRLVPGQPKGQSGNIPLLPGIQLYP